MFSSLPLVARHRMARGLSLDSGCPGELRQQQAPPPPSGRGVSRCESVRSEARYIGQKCSLCMKSAQICQKNLLDGRQIRFFSFPLLLIIDAFYSRIKFLRVWMTKNYFYSLVFLWLVSYLEVAFIFVMVDSCFWLIWPLYLTHLCTLCPLLVDKKGVCIYIKPL